MPMPITTDVYKMVHNKFTSQDVLAVLRGQSHTSGFTAAVSVLAASIMSLSLDKNRDL